jgi:hypothetical protein
MAEFAADSETGGKRPDLPLDRRAIPHRFPRIVVAIEAQKDDAEKGGAVISTDWASR